MEVPANDASLIRSDEGVPIYSSDYRVNPEQRVAISEIGTLRDDWPVSGGQ
jgi:hypothetical protein